MVPITSSKFTNQVLWELAGFQEVLFLNMGVAVLGASASLMVYTIVGSCCVARVHTEGGRWQGGGAFLLPHSNPPPPPPPTFQNSQNITEVMCLML